MAPRERLAGESETGAALQEPLLSQDDVSLEGTSLFDRYAARNRSLTILYTAFAFGGRSVWSHSVLPTYVYFLNGHNAAQVGYLTAIMGLAQLLASIPAGVLADRYRRRHRNLQLAGAMGVVATIAMFVSIELYYSFGSLEVALILWGCTYGVANTTLTSLFADSIEAGQRSKFFTRRSITLTLANVIGPSISLILFAYLGNHWTKSECRSVLLFGQAIALPSLVLLCFFREVSAPEPQPMIDENDDRGNGTPHQPLLSETHIDPETVVSNVDEMNNSTDQNPVDVICNGYCLPKHRVIPVFIATADLISGLGSGMSIRYFPLFFVDNLQLSPVIVQLLFMLGPVTQAILMKITQSLALSYGRCRVTVVFKWVGVTLMASMVGAYQLHWPTWLVCVLYVLRTGFMNSTSPLTRSMLMDNVPSHERGKWSVLEGVNMFSWSGSAAIGGVLVHYIGIVPLFVVTGFIQFLSSLTVLALVRVDQREAEATDLVDEHDPAREDEREDDSGGSAGTDIPTTRGAENLDEV